MIPLGWILFFHDGSGGADRVQVRTVDEWRSLPTTGCLGVREVYEERSRKGTGPHYSNVFTAEWVWIEADSAGVWKTHHSHEETPPIGVDRRDVKQGLEIPDEKWAAIYPRDFHNRIDSAPEAWLV